MTNFINKKVIIRSYGAGVFFGTLVDKQDAKAGTEVELKNARRIFYWDGACSCTDLALIGTTKPNNCQITRPVENIVIANVIEIIPCTEKAIEVIESVPEWTKY